MSRRCAAAVLFAVVPATALAQSPDVEYARKIREYTTDPMFLTELVDHLPASATVPSPLKFNGYWRDAPIGSPSQGRHALP